MIDGRICNLPTVKGYNFIADKKKINYFKELKKKFALIPHKSSLLGLPQLKLHTGFINTALSFFV